MGLISYFKNKAEQRRKERNARMINSSYTSNTYSDSGCGIDVLTYAAVTNVLSDSSDDSGNS